MLVCVTGKNNYPYSSCVLMCPSKEYWHKLAATVKRCRE